MKVLLCMESTSVVGVVLDGSLLGGFLVWKVLV